MSEKADCGVTGRCSGTHAHLDLLCKPVFTWLVCYLKTCPKARWMEIIHKPFHTQLKRFSKCLKTNKGVGGRERERDPLLRYPSCQATVRPAHPVLCACYLPSEWRLVPSCDPTPGPILCVLFAWLQRSVAPMLFSRC